MMADKITQKLQVLKKINEDVKFCKKVRDFLQSVAYNIRMDKSLLYYGASEPHKYKDVLCLLKSWGYNVYWKKSVCCDGYWNLHWKGKLQ